MKPFATLPDALAADYELLTPNLPIRGSYGRFNTVDFRTLTAAQADQLLLFGFPHLRKKAKPDAADAKTLASTEGKPLAQNADAHIADLQKEKPKKTTKA